MKFAFKRKLVRHVNGVHLKMRPFSCKEDDCQVKFVCKRDWKKHVILVHLKKKHFPCKEDGCRAKFGQKRDLERHVDSVHLKKRPFSCKEDGCQLKFARKTDLDRHVDNVHLKNHRPSKPKSKDKKGATGADSVQGGDKVKMSKGVAASDLLIHPGRGDEENNNKEVAKKRTTLTENSAGGNGMKTLCGIQGVGICRPARFSAKKSVGWYLEEEHEFQEESEQTSQQQFKCKDCKLGFSSSYKLRRYFSTSLHLFI